MKKKSILIVFSDKNFAQITSQKVNLLRSNDDITFVTYNEINNIKEQIIPSLILVCIQDKQSLSIIDELKIEFTNTPIILVTQNNSEDIYIEAYEKEIDEFFSLNDSEAIILMRILNAIKRKNLQQKFDLNQNILINENYIDKETYIYKKDFTQNILSTIFNNILKEETDNFIYLHLKLIEEENPKIRIKEIAQILKNSLRRTDIITFGEDNSFNIILENINEEQTIDLINKINSNLNRKYLIYYTATKITKSYEDTMKILESLIDVQIEDKEYFIFIDDIEQVKLSDIINIQTKKEDSSQREFIKKIENIVAPVFYQSQTKYSERLKKAEINYCINNSETVFSIKKDEIRNELSITYNSFDNIAIDVIECLNENITKERKIIYNIENFTEEKLTEEIENMIKDFIETDSINTINKETYETK